MQRAIQPGDSNPSINKRQFDLAGVQSSNPMKVQLSDGTSPDGPDVLTHRHMGHPGEHSIALRHSKESADPLHKEEDSLVDRYKDMYRQAMRGELPPAREGEMLEVIAKLKEIQSSRLEEAKGVAGYDDLDESVIESEGEEMKEYPYDVDGEDLSYDGIDEDYEEEEVDDLDLARRYLKPGENAPEGFKEEQGQRGGRFYDDGRGDGASIGDDDTSNGWDDEYDEDGNDYNDPEDDDPEFGDDGYEDEFGDDGYEDEPLPCSTCGGPLQPMGGLGKKQWYQCRNCGMQESRDAEEEESEPELHEDTMGVSPDALEPEPMDDYEAYGDEGPDNDDYFPDDDDEEFGEYTDEVREVAERDGMNPVDALGRVVASAYHGGGGSQMYQFASTGDFTNPAAFSDELKEAYRIAQEQDDREAMGVFQGLYNEAENRREAAEAENTPQAIDPQWNMREDDRPRTRQYNYVDQGDNLYNAVVQTSSLWGSGVRIRQSVLGKAEPTIPEGHESGGAEWDERYKIATGDSGGKNKDVLGDIEDVNDQHGVVPGGDDIEDVEEVDTIYPETPESDYKSSNALAWVKGVDRVLTPDQIGKAQMSSLDTHGRFNKAAPGQFIPIVRKAVPGMDVSLHGDHDQSSHGRKHDDPDSLDEFEGWADHEDGDDRWPPIDPAGSKSKGDDRPESGSQIDRLKRLAVRHAELGNKRQSEEIAREIGRLQRRAGQ